ncbi:16S rRNA (cytidine(1402)-2'-O)-methyltransferase [Radiobacillus sp. PE A8.2]|uniref:16S rRNA (cytidine(1402)-2'-O)-methyltransferase n=1 Tax=Radiobacillus sp. PE A8.2 TaxID=3380349 RepID=UPI00388F3103
MQTQSSFQGKYDTGTLYIVPTPIGNLEDITLRAIRILKESDLIAAEDTRNTRKLLNHLEIDTPLTSYHEHNKLTKDASLIDKLRTGMSIALVSDAGMPGISDPGYELVQGVLAADIAVVVLPGANAALCALVGSGLSTDEFYFYGFLPRKKRQKEEELNRLKSIQASLLFYESPHRLVETLEALYEHLGDRNVTLARELTKRFEEYVRGSLTETIIWAKQSEIRGEFCIVVEGAKEAEQKEQAEWWLPLSIKQHVNHHIEGYGLSSKEAIKVVAEERKLPKRDVYQAYHVE